MTSARSRMVAPAHVLLVGGGHASVYALTRAERLHAAGARVTLLSDRPYLVYSGMTPEWLGGVYSADDVRVDLKGWCNQTGVRFEQGQVAEIDRATRAVTTTDGRRYTADLVAVDVGAQNPHEGAAGPATQTKPLHRIERLASLLDTYERQNAEEELARGQDPYHLAIVGGGAAGVEVALNVTARFAGRPFRCTLIEPAERLVPGFPAAAAARMQTVLQSRGTRLLFGTTAERVAVQDDGRSCVVLQDGPPLIADAVLWATGSRGPDLFRAPEWPTDEKGFLRVTAALRCRVAPWLLAAGDNAVVEGHETLARVGVHAVKQGPVLLENLLRLVRGLRAGHPAEAVRLRRFVPYPAAPLLLSTGTDRAFGVAGPVWGEGTPLLRLKHAADRRWMRKYRITSAHRHPLFSTEHAAQSSS